MRARRKETAACADTESGNRENEKGRSRRKKIGKPGEFRVKGGDEIKRARVTLKRCLREFFSSGRINA